MTQIDIDQKIYDLYDEYCHGFMERREFLRQASAFTVAGVSGLAMAQASLKQDMLNSAGFVKSHELSTGKLGAVGFCWGGGITNFLAVEMGDGLSAGVPFYGAAPAVADVPGIAAPLMIQSAEDDPRINAMWPEFEEALVANQKRYEHHLYQGTRHGFHNYSTPRYNEAAARLAWQRTVAFFQEYLG